MHVFHDSSDGERHTIHLSGRLDAADRAAFLASARDMLAKGKGGIVDASALEVWDLATFQLVLALRRDVSATGEQVQLVGVRPDAAALQAATGLGQALADSLAWEVW